MHDAEGRVSVVYNGEIYNHRELRRELEAAGHRFRTDHSDTEVLVHGWKQWGERLTERLNGMFAFALWDARRRSLFLARDRFGVKPLYLAELPGDELLFGSEVRALHASGLLERRENPAAVLEYFSFQNNWHGRTPFAGIRMLQPGTSLLVDRDRRRERRFWQIAFSRHKRPTITAAAEAYRELLLGAVRRQLDADVPVMTYLSGGIDSSAITAAAHRLNRDVKSYSCIFDLDAVGDDRIVDEREFSRGVAAALGIERVELELPQNTLESSLDRTIRALEYPRMGMAYVNYLIAGRVAADAKVVLSGTGGDEISGGYVGRYGIVPRDPLPFWRSLLRRIRRQEPTPDALAVFRRALNFPIAAHELDAALTPEFRRAAAGFSPMAEIDALLAACPSRDPWDKVMYADTVAYLHGLLVLEDKLSMAHGLEARVPLLDNVLVDTMLELDWSLLTDGQTGKQVFREAVRPWVPDEIYRKPKMGFGPPDASWYRGRLRPFIERRLDLRAIAARGVLRPDFVRRKLDDHFAGRANNVAFIWSMLSFETWCETAGVFGGRLRAPEMALPA
jgi:asparagine synthase (glutamine-hydrolysing)